MRMLLTLLACLLAPLAALADDRPRLDPSGLVPGEEAVAVEIVDGDTLRLEDGRQVRLVGLQAPKLPLGRPGFEAWPLADAAKDALAALALNRRLRLSYGGLRRDRHGRVLAHLHDAEGIWIQGAMLARGMARVYSFSDNRAAVAEMLALEAEARAAGRGIWSHPFYRVRTAEDVGAAGEGYHLVEGRVRQVARPRSLTYLNFGEDWRSDFTVSANATARRLFEKAGIDLAGYENRRIRVRGWVSSFNGPLIEVTHPEQIEMLDPAPEPATKSERKKR
ncbi:MAG: thermonuclease family protein [Alphaproteobacteria bacterium]